MCDEACSCDEKLWHSTLAVLLFFSSPLFFLNSVGGLMKEK